MDDRNQPNNEPIGYGNPPAHTRFKKGRREILKGSQKERAIWRASFTGRSESAWLSTRTGFEES